VPASGLPALVSNFLRQLRQAAAAPPDFPTRKLAARPRAVADPGTHRQPDVISRGATGCDGPGVPTPSGGVLVRLRAAWRGVVEGQPHVTAGVHPQSTPSNAGTKQLPRIALELMKEADGPVSVRYLAGRALALKGCPYPTPSVMKQTRRRLSSAMTAWNKRGLVVKLGSWRTCRHVLARPGLGGRLNVC
jgi:hypothetical protein